MHERISADPAVLHGRPCVRNTRIAVAMVLELLEAGLTFDDISRDFYPQLSKEDVGACVEYARKSIENEEVRFVQELVPA